MKKLFDIIKDMSVIEFVLLLGGTGELLYHGVSVDNSRIINVIK